ncbi:MAG: Gfo/Idh/MocA family oxidoreductase [Treponema sp.]|nr:Gfo/Idh/MocA family oxidoreductase [Treponema sp.]
MKYRVALIGCGRISFKHIEAFVNNKDIMDLVAVCDIKLDKAKEKREDYLKEIPTANVSVYSDYNKMLSEIHPDLITIATPSGLHCKIACDALNSKVNVITEKPMALSTNDAQKMIDTARFNNKKLAVCFQNRFNIPVQRVREAYEKGRFGRILHGMIQVRWNRNEAYYSEASWRGTWEQDGGTLMNQCTHGIDLLQWMMGEDAVRVQAQTRRFLRPISAEDFGCAIVEFKSGAVGIIEGSADIYPKNLCETLSLFGEKGTVVIGGLAVNKIENWRFSDSEIVGDTEEHVLDPNSKDPPTVYGFGHSALFRDVLESIKYNREPLVNGEKGKKALDIILAIYESQKTGLPVTLPNNFSTMDMKGIF